MSLRLASIGLFASAAIVAVAGILTYAWPAVDSFMFWAAGFVLGLFGLVAGSAHAYFSKPESRWWGPLGVGAALLVASVTVAPFASALSSGAFVMVHRAELDRAASILLSSERASATASGTSCQGLSPAACSELSSTLRSIGAHLGWNGSGGVRIRIRGDYYAAVCPSSCGVRSFPVSQKWRLVTA